MLIRFSTRNYRSFKDEIEFLLIPGRVRSHKNHLIKSNSSVGIDILKTAVIYGPNAAGKSNLIKAINTAKNIVVTGKIPNTLYRQGFKFDQQKNLKSMKFDFDIKINNKYYNYGFEILNNCIKKEWLFEINKKREFLLFFREQINEDYKTEFGNAIYKDMNKKENDILNLTKNTIRKNQLFLYKTIDNQLEKLKFIYNWFKELIVLFPESRYLPLEIQIKDSDEFKHVLLQYLRKFDININDIILKKINIKDIVDIPEEMIDDVLTNLRNKEITLISSQNNRRYLISKTNGKLNIFKIMTKYIINNKNYELELYDESDGTLRLLDIIPALKDLSKKNVVYVIDEIDRSLHTQICFEILNNFLNKSQNINSQLIVTTHNTNLLDLKLLRRDEIWFLNRKQDLSSEIFSLEEYDPRYDKDISKDYLLGRYNAIPNITK